MISLGKLLKSPRKVLGPGRERQASGLYETRLVKGNVLGYPADEVVLPKGHISEDN